MFLKLVSISGKTFASFRCSQAPRINLLCFGATRRPLRLPRTHGDMELSRDNIGPGSHARKPTLAMPASELDLVQRGSMTSKGG
eukprot:766792-Hanusia_phi.AAC.3